MHSSIKMEVMLSSYKEASLLTRRPSVNRFHFVLLKLLLN